MVSVVPVFPPAMGIAIRQRSPVPLLKVPSIILVILSVVEPLSTRVDFWLWLLTTWPLAFRSWCNEVSIIHNPPLAKVAHRPGAICIGLVVTPAPKATVSDLSTLVHIGPNFSPYSKTVLRPKSLAVATAGRLRDLC